MPKIKFTKANVAKLALPARGKQVDWFENLKPGRSLILSLSYAGTRSWSVLYYDHAKPRRAKLGSYPQMDPAAARAMADAYDVDAALGRRVAGSFGEVAEDWYARAVVRQGLITAPESRRILDKQILPKWRDLPFLEVRSDEVSRLVEETIDRNGKGSADALLAVVRRITGWYGDLHHETYRSPVSKGIRKRLNLIQPPRARWLSNEEIRIIWQGCEQLGTFGALVRMLLLTGQRRSKVSGMRWDALDGTTWTIPRAEREKSTPPALTLPPLAMEVLAGLPRLFGNPFVFASTRGGGAITFYDDGIHTLDALLPANTKPWVLHDLRRTCRKLLTRVRVPTDVAELVLGHSIKGIQATYDDPEEYEKAIAEALALVAAEIARIVNPPPANVVQLHQLG